jgi:hypothetical protein
MRMASLETVETDQLLTTPEAGRRLGIGTEDVYRLIFAGELDGGPDRTGVVKVSVTAIDQYLAAHRAG